MGFAPLPALARKRVHGNRLNKLNVFLVFSTLDPCFFHVFFPLSPHSAFALPPVWLQCASSVAPVPMSGAGVAL